MATGCAVADGQLFNVVCDTQHFDTDSLSAQHSLEPWTEHDPFSKRCLFSVGRVGSTSLDAQIDDEVAGEEALFQSRYHPWNDIETGQDLHKRHVLMSLGGSIVQLQADAKSDFGKWTSISEPLTEGELRRAHDRAEWQLVQELKLETYKNIPVWKLIPKSDVKPGETIFPLKWVRKKKLRSSPEGDTVVRNPRLCMIGTRMNRALYNPFSDQMLIRTLKIMCAICGTYNLFGFTADASDAFQDTPDNSVAEGRPRVLTHQAPGHEVLGPGNIKMCYELIAMLQGRIDSCNVFGTKRDDILLSIPGMRRAPYDPSTFIYHVGPLANTSASLTDIVAKYVDKSLPNIAAFTLEKGSQEIPAQPPHGWAMLGTHVDDLPGIATSEEVVRYICLHIHKFYGMKCVGWERANTLGALIQHDRKKRTVSMTADRLIDKLVEEHLSGEVIIQPKHVTTPAIMHLNETDPQSISEGVDPSCKQKVQSLLGGLQYLSNFYPQVTMPANRNGRFAANPTMQNLRSLKYPLMHLHSHRHGLLFGGINCVTLESDPSPPENPYVDWVTDKTRYYRPHGFADANLEDPRSTSALDFVIAGCTAETIVSRQHCTAKTVHDSETIACSDLVAKLEAIRGLLQAASIHQIHSTPIYSDSESTAKVSNDQASPRRAMYLMLRARFITDSFHAGDTNVIHISGLLNPADRGTKYLSFDPWWRYTQYIMHIIL